MKDFFKKIWEWIKTNVKKAWDWFIAFLLSVPITKVYYFAAGLIIGAFIAILGVDETAMYPLVGVIAIALAKEALVYMLKNKWSWQNFLATSIGGLIIQLIVFLKW